MTTKTYFNGVTLKDMAELVGIAISKGSKSKIEKRFGEQFIVKKHPENDLFVIVEEIGDAVALTSELAKFCKEIDNAKLRDNVCTKLVSVLESGNFKEFRELLDAFKGMHRDGIKSGKKWSEK